jgi:hypothetical protein
MYSCDVNEAGAYPIYSSSLPPLQLSFLRDTWTIHPSFRKFESVI